MHSHFRGEKLRLYDEDRTIVESTRTCTYAQYAKYPLKTGLLMEMLGWCCPSIWSKLEMGVVSVINAVLLLMRAHKPTFPDPPIGNNEHSKNSHAPVRAWLDSKRCGTHSLFLFFWRGPIEGRGGPSRITGEDTAKRRWQSPPSAVSCQMTAAHMNHRAAGGAGFPRISPSH